MKKDKKSQTPQKNTLFSFLSPIKKSQPNSEIEDLSKFVFKPKSQEDSSDIVERKKQKLSLQTENSNEIIDFSSDEKENTINEITNTQRTPISSGKKQERFSFLVDLKDKNGIRRGEENYDPTSLFISEKEFNSMTDFEKQFWAIKKEYFDTVIFFKKGKFYELYEDDAEIGSKLFDLKLTERVNMKMAGFPEKSYDYWAGKFLENGYKVAKVDQTENMIGKSLREKDNTKKEKIIKRELKEIITKGTIYNSDHLKSFDANFLGIVCFSKNISYILYEASFNKVFFGTFTEDSLSNFKNLIFTNEIKELVYEIDKNEKNENYFLFLEKIKEKITVENINKFKKEDFSIQIEKIKKFVVKFINNEEYKCFTNLIEYMFYLKRESFLERLEIYNFKEKENNFIFLDNFTIQNLELLKNNYDNSQKNSLFSVINFCVTGCGQRLLKKYMINPSKDLSEIQKRQNFTKKLEKIDFFTARELLKQIGDIERIFGKIFSNNPQSKDVIFFIKTLEKISSLRNKLNEISLDFPDTKIILEKFNEKYFVEEEEILPEKNSDDELNTLKQKESEIYGRLTEYLNKKKKELNCDIKFKNIGKEIFQMEIPINVEIPSEFFLVSSTKNTKRFYSAELKEMIKEYVENDELIFQSKGSLLRRVVQFLMGFNQLIEDVCQKLSELDVFFSYAIFSKTYNTTYPIFSNKLSIEGLRNPIYQNFVETDVFLNESNILILTGPNMGGKSTLMRSICYNIILAQMGMKVFCKKLELKLFDNIFTRIGASDNLEKGESTFYIELNETSKILRKATENTFIIMDELGRGTSVKDGQAIATAVLNYLKKKDCTLIFSTHYFNIVDKVIGVNKGYMDVELFENEVIFKYQLVNGVSNDSLGISVASIANLPNEIIKKALFYKNKFNK
ncbi:hypothetical protein TUBRATIS_26570 [Tubulinosema ratisbonensis]|uniref:DNA mismatch repair proteins mutS family domain-containing protein n=1 Tax=Tubulinosema ratisbonensis TaxID=291195 RepID=A0A437AIL2_9MICR|nr:hypothetical protein TUBRATIS_26570 [Tubulinosema ratisbonensis]